MEPKVTAILMLMVADTLSNPNRIVNYNVFCVLSTSIENLISIFFLFSVSVQQTRDCRTAARSLGISVFHCNNSLQHNGKRTNGNLAHSADYITMVEKP